MLLMLMSIFLNWSAGMFLLDNGEGGRNSWRRRVVLIGVAVLNLILLGYFKYAGFFVDFCNHISGREMPVPKIALPIGISFFLLFRCYPMSLMFMEEIVLFRKIR